jgi:predicted nucleic acid-binding protein
MPVVSNTSPLLNLSIIGHLDLVRTQFDRVLIPPAVLDELHIDSSRPGAGKLKNAIGEGWISVQDVTDAALIRTLRRDLDQGEAEAIALAMELDASLILLDEQEGRKRARTLDLPITGAIGILLQADRNGRLSSLRDALDRLEDDAGFWIAPSLRERVLRDDS